MFRSTDSKGFHITFANGITASVQWGPGNYCGNRETFDPLPAPDHHGATAETAFLRPDGSCMGKPEGWQTPAQVLAFLNMAANMPAVDISERKGA